MDDDAWHRVVGVVLAVCSGVFIGSSFILKKKGLLMSEKTHGEIGQGHSYLKSGFWWAGLILMGLGEACNFGAYAFVPAIIVTPLGALSVVISAILSSIFLNEKLNFSGQVGCAQCITGATIIVLNASTTSSTSTIPEFFSLVISPGFLAYCGVLLFFVLYLIYQISPRYGAKYPIVYISICSIVGSFLVVGIQGLGSAIVYTASNWESDNQFRYWNTYLLMGFVIFAVCSQIHFLNKALNKFSTAIVTPVYYVFFTTSTLITSAVLFRGFPVNGMLSAFMMVTGFLVIVGGVALLFEFNTQMARERQLTEHLASYPNVVCDDDERSSSSSDSNDEMIPAFDSDEDDDSVILMNDDEDLAFNRCAKRNENFFTGIFSQKPRLALETVEVQPKRVSLTQIAETKKRHLYMQQEVIEESCDDSAKASESDHPEIQSRAVTFAIDWSSPKS